MFRWLCISIYSCKGSQLHAQFIMSIFHQMPLHVSGVSTARHQEAHRSFTKIGTYCLFLDGCLLLWVFHVSGVYTTHHQEAHRMFTRVLVVFLAGCLLSWLGWNTHNNRQPSKETININFVNIRCASWWWVVDTPETWNTHDNRQPSKETISTNFCKHMVCLLMTGGGYAQTCRDVWWNILPINCASSWFPLNKELFVFCLVLSLSYCLCNQYYISKLFLTFFFTCCF